MSKETKKQRKMAKSNIKILKSGKIKISKEQKLDLTPFIEGTINNTIVSRLNGIISKEEVVIDEEKNIDIRAHLIDELECVRLKNEMKEPDIPTFVYVVNKKDATNIFDLLNVTVFGDVLRSSTLAAAYKNVKQTWVDLNENDKTPYINIMYVPEVMIFLDHKTGKIRKRPIFANVLIVAIPPRKYINNKDENVEEATIEESINYYIDSICESIIKLGIKNVVVNPFFNNASTKNACMSSEAWVRNIRGNRFIDNVNKIEFCVEDENTFIYLNIQLNNN